MADSIACPACGASGSLETEKCDYCGSPLKPASAWLGIREPDEVLFQELSELEVKLLKQPNNAKYMVQVAQIQFKLGRYSSAQEILDKAAKISPDKAEIWYWLACSMAMKLGWGHRSVEEHAQRAHGLDSALTAAGALAYLSRGTRQCLMGYSRENLTAAIENFKQAISLDSGNTYAYFYAGYACEKLGQTDDAIYFFEQASRRAEGDPLPPKEDAKIFARLGSLYSKAGNLASAQKSFTEALRLDPDNAAVRQLADQKEFGP